MNKNAIILALVVALSILCSARGEEEKQTEDLKKKENFAIIAPNGAPIVPSTIPGALSLLVIFGIFVNYSIFWSCMR